MERVSEEAEERGNECTEGAVSANSRNWLILEATKNGMNMQFVLA